MIGSKGITESPVPFLRIRQHPKESGSSKLADSLGGVDINLSPEERAEIPAVPPGRWVGSDPVYDGAL